jgi:hypothetical protein
MDAKPQYHVGTVIIIGIVNPLPLVGFPPGRALICMCENYPVTVEIITGSEVTIYYIKEIDGTWRPAFDKAQNVAILDS